MNIPFSVIDDLIIPSQFNRYLFSNREAEKDIILRLPKLQNGKLFEVLLLSEFKVTLHCNSEVTRFLTSPPKLKLTIGGTPACVGRSVTITAFENYWRIIHSTVPEPNIVFEE